jgi:pyruvate-ferredoxin/flavodoxin oxidoreductase
MRQAVSKFYDQAIELMSKLRERSEYSAKKDLFGAIMNSDQSDQGKIEEQRARIEELKESMAGDGSLEARGLLSLADYLVAKSVWAVGGDGWAYDIGYGGLDHVLASGENINILILDTEVYSNTGGQMSKSTPLAAMAQFAAGGKKTPKKSIGAIMTTYGNVYVAQVAFGANQSQTVKAMLEAESYNGPSLVVAYATCIAQGIDMAKGVEEQKRAVACGHWPLYRYNPFLEAQGKPPLSLDSKDPTLSFAEYAYNENRYKALRLTNPAIAEALMKQAEADVKRRWEYLKHLAKWKAV